MVTTGGKSGGDSSAWDRLLTRATVINIKKPSSRLRECKALTKPLTDLAGPPEKARGGGAWLVPGARTRSEFQ